ncbi:MAG: hypothetical protein V1898_04700 [Patescibacteria group bacterium]
MKKKLLSNHLGIAWIPVIIYALLGSGIAIGGGVAYNDWHAGREARANQQTAEAKQILHDELNEYFNRYRQNCFSQVASIGDRNTYQNALDEIILAYKDGKNSDSFAQYTKNIIYTQKPVGEYDLTNNAIRQELQDTIWHELTHHLELKNRDRLSFSMLNPRRSQVAARNERHAEYMKQMVGILNQLMRIENKVRKNEMTGAQVKAQFEVLLKQYNAGSSNEYEPVPSDLDKFQSYTGFRVNFPEIIEFYKKGTCIQFPAGSFSTSTNNDISDENVNTVVPTDTYVVWEATNVSVGLVITTKNSYEAQELARSYPGGGLDPNLLIEKKLVSGAQEFETFAQAETWLCNQFVEVWYAPLGVGWMADWDGRHVILANTSCGK